jgi:hypothetical protein
MRHAHCSLYVPLSVDSQVAEASTGSRPVLRDQLDTALPAFRAAGRELGLI